MVINKIHSWPGSILCFLSLALLVWAEWPVNTLTREIVFQSGELQILVPSQTGYSQDLSAIRQETPLAFVDERRVKLEWTPLIRKGDHSQIKLSFSGNIPSKTEDLLESSVLPPVVTGNENLFDVYTVDALARIDLSGLKVTPEGISGQVLIKDHDVEFIWIIKSEEEGSYEGVSWLYLRSYPLDGGDFIEQAVAAQSFNIKVASFLGLKTIYWRVIGVLGIIIGLYVQNKHIIGIILRTYQAIVNKFCKIL